MSDIMQATFWVFIVATPILPLGATSRVTCMVVKKLLLMFRPYCGSVMNGTSYFNVLFHDEMCPPVHHEFSSVCCQTKTQFFMRSWFSHTEQVY